MRCLIKIAVSCVIQSYTSFHAKQSELQHASMFALTIRYTPR